MRSTSAYSRFKYLLLLLVFLLPASSLAQLKLSKLVSDGMVLQREMETHVWGWAQPGHSVEVVFAEKTHRTKADKSGKWRSKLPEMQAGGPFEMTITSGDEKIQITDILVGDVWVCSGQSNMEWPVRLSMNPDEEIAAATDSFIRHFKVPRSHADLPQDELAGGEWQRATPETAGDFTAVGYYFARELRKATGVPIGLLNSSWGGSRVEPWMRAKALGYDDAETAIKEIRRKAEEIASKQRADLIEKIGEVGSADAGMRDGEALWAAENVTMDGWSSMTLPVFWERAGYRNMDGIVWFRKTVTLSEAQATSGAKLILGKIDDTDIAWVNGQRVGGMTQAWDTIRKYKVAPEILRAGENTIVVRVEDTGGNGGIWGEPAQMTLRSEGDELSLAGDWHFRVGALKIASLSRPNQIPMILYNKMIHPILDYRIKGAIWYQGESNASDKDAYNYRDLFAGMIGDWRKIWNSGEFPFLFVQLANFRAPDAQPAESAWAVLRESQSATLAVPNTAQAVIIDIGEANDIHPRNKQDVGKRLSLAARKLAYGEDLVYSGPVYKKHSIAGNKVRIKFAHTGSGLYVKDKYGYVKAFAVAGMDKKFVWAQARVDGDTVVVWSDQVAEPVAVRYAWGNNPDDVNLYNQEGLPASPFRTDNW